jgi:hypothetical protein
VTRQLIENDDGDMRSWLRLESKKHYLVWFLSWKIFHEDQLPKNELKRNQARLISPISLSDGRSAPAGPRGRRKGQRASSPRLRNSHRWRDSDTRPAAERRSNFTSVDCMHQSIRRHSGVASGEERERPLETIKGGAGVRWLHSRTARQKPRLIRTEVLNRIDLLPTHTRHHVAMEPRARRLGFRNN